VAAPEEAAEGMTNFLWELGALGVVEERAPGGRPGLRAFFAPSTERAPIEASVRTFVEGLRVLGFEGLEEPRTAAVPDTDWNRAWRDHFRPLPVGRRLLIRPPWEPGPSTDRVAIVIEPGRAFGTGHHGSTAGCLEALEVVVAERRPALALDLGTGSGILAIAAVRLGVARVLALDEDPDAVAVAAANAAVNGVGDQVRCVVGGADARVEPPAPLVLANLLTAAHERLGPAYRRAVAPGGVLILGGILDAEAAALETVVGDHGFALRRRRSVDGWSTLEFERDPTE